MGKYLEIFIYWVGLIICAWVAMFIAIILAISTYNIILILLNL
jgi:hypothetical protein